MTDRDYALLAMELEVAIAQRRGARLDRVHAVAIGLTGLSLAGYLFELWLWWFRVG